MLVDPHPWRILGLWFWAYQEYPLPNGRTLGLQSWAYQEYPLPPPPRNWYFSRRNVSWTRLVCGDYCSIPQGYCLVLYAVAFILRGQPGKEIPHYTVCMSCTHSVEWSTPLAQDLVGLEGVERGTCCQPHKSWWWPCVSNYHISGGWLIFLITHNLGLLYSFILGWLVSSYILPIIVPTKIFHISSKCCMAQKCILVLLSKQWHM